jgi:hypothetical protein
MSPRLERLIVVGIKRREEINSRYLSALTTYEVAIDDPTKHPDYLSILRQEIWQKLISLAANKEYKDAPTWFKHLAVKREMERDTWAYMENEIAPAYEREPQIEVSEETPLKLTHNSNGHV